MNTAGKEDNCMEMYCWKKEIKIKLKKKKNYNPLAANHQSQ